MKIVVLPLKCLIFQVLTKSALQNDCYTRGLMVITKEFLIEFENHIADLFNSGKIKAPVHLSSGGEVELIDIFSRINPSDYVFSTWRSHYHALLKGIPPTRVLEKIISGNSISLNFPDYNFFSSAIVGTHVPVAVGVAYALKKNSSQSNVWCFMGDMASETGIAHTSIKYAARYQLPITFVIEDNNLSVCTDTRKVWNTSRLSYQDSNFTNILSYSYQSDYPHSGAGVRVQF